MKPTIAILGWGSLIWDPHPEFTATIGPWASDGPVLPVEFCRIADSRAGALALVIDRELGTPVTTLHARSERSSTKDALRDLRRREQTSAKKIGFVDLVAGEARGRDDASIAAIADWAGAREIDVALWTDLESNFRARTHDDFTPAAALAYLQGLSAEGRAQAVKYIVRAPEQVNTALREWLATVPWFLDQVALYGEAAWIDDPPANETPVTTPTQARRRARDCRAPPPPSGHTGDGRPRAPEKP